ncbi:hypothetical protein KM043_007478 [Ampulex compressa]|nr:hypothetical protein KM043_007478 [Ampulex compressa]
MEKGARRMSKKENKLEKLAGVRMARKAEGGEIPGEERARKSEEEEKPAVAPREDEKTGGVSEIADKAAIDAGRSEARKDNEEKSEETINNSEKKTGHRARAREKNSFRYVPRSAPG